MIMKRLIYEFLKLKTFHNLSIKSSITLSSEIVFYVLEPFLVEFGLCEATPNEMILSVIEHACPFKH